MIEITEDGIFVDGVQVARIEWLASATWSERYAVMAAKINPNSDEYEDCYG